MNLKYVMEKILSEVNSFNSLITAYSLKTAVNNTSLGALSKEAQSFYQARYKGSRWCFVVVRDVTYDMKYTKEKGTVYVIDEKGTVFDRIPFAYYRDKTKVFRRFGNFIEETILNNWEVV